MLKTNADELRWCGIDMRKRQSRRIAVVATYAVFLCAVWMHSPRISVVVVSVWTVSVFAGVWPVLADRVPSWLGKAITSCGWLIAGWLGWRAPAHPGRLDPSICMYATYLLVVSSVVAWNKMVDNGYKGWLGRAVRSGKPGSWRQQRRLARIGFAIGLDGFAHYYFSERFEKLSEKDKEEVESLNRAHPRGLWMRNKEHILFDDERMRHEEDRLRAHVQTVMTGTLLLSAVGAGLLWARDALKPAFVVEWAWTLAALAATLRQAIVLWSEEDPIALSGEIEMVREMEVG